MHLIPYLYPYLGSILTGKALFFKAKDRKEVVATLTQTA
jgi:hypothetical protein